MWKKVAMSINGETPNSVSDEHHLRSYFFFLMNNTPNQKTSTLGAAGYHFDPGVIVGRKNSSGFNIRRNKFRLKDLSAYSGVEVPFVGPLFTDFMTTTVGCPPKSKIRLSFHRNPDPLLIESYDG
jgi:hypothetical protein